MAFYSTIKPTWGPQVFAGLCAIFVGIGLARFAYSPLLPAMIQEGWFPATHAGYLGAANLIGYLAGAVVGAPLASRGNVRALLRRAMAVTAVSLIACGTPLRFEWLLAWRTISGITGGILMVVAPATVMGAVPAVRRGVASGIIFTGVGAGIVCSGVFVPLLVEVGPGTTWVVLGTLAAGLTAAAWSSWPSDPASIASAARPAAGSQIGSLFAVNAAVAAAYIPFMVFLADYVARGLGWGIATASVYWVILGIGALAGPLFAGRLGDAIGFGRALAMTMPPLVACPLWVVLAPTPLSLGISAFVIGSFIPGITAITLGRIHELVKDSRRRQEIWRTATVFFAIGQATGAYGMSVVFSANGGAYRPLFMIGSLAGALAAVALVVGNLASLGRTR